MAKVMACYSKFLINQSNYIGDIMQVSKMTKEQIRSYLRGGKLQQATVNTQGIIVKYVHKTTQGSK